MVYFAIVLYSLCMQLKAVYRQRFGIQQIRKTFKDFRIISICTVKKSSKTEVRAKLKGAYTVNSKIANFFQVLQHGRVFSVYRKQGREDKAPDWIKKFDIVTELKSWDLWRAVLAEGVSTMLFVLIGSMAALDLQQTDQGDRNAKFIRIAFAFGLMIAVCIQMIGHVSGGHMNPAVSIAMAVSCKISPFRALFYCLAQSIGGILGSLILKGLSPDRSHDNLAVTQINEDLHVWQGLSCEIVFTFILVMSIMGCTDSDRPFFGSPALGIGLTVAVVHLAAIPFTGASMNPARSLGSAVISNVYDDHWVYWVGPICGGIVAALAYKYIFNPYKGCLSYEEVSSKLLDDTDMIVIPRSYFSQEKNVGSSAQTSVHEL